MGDIFEHNIKYQDGSNLLIFFKILSKKNTPYTRTELIEYLNKYHNSLNTGLSCSGLATNTFVWCLLANGNTITVYRGTGFTTTSTSGTVNDTIIKIY